MILRFLSHTLMYMVWSYGACEILLAFEAML